MNTNIVIVKRMIIKDLEQNSLLRVIFIDTISFSIWVCRIDDNSWPYPIRSEFLQSEIERENGVFSVNQDDPYRILISLNGSETNSDRKHKERLKLIYPLVSGENERLILFTKQRNSLIRNTVETENVSRQTIINLLKQFWKRGMTYSSLRPDYSNCGGRGKPRNLTGKKVGARRTIATGTGINANNEVKKVLKVGADYYFSKKGASLISAHDHAIRLFYAKSIYCENGVLKEKTIDPEKVPTVRQLQYYIKKTYSYQHIRRRRNGDKHYDLNEREIIGFADGDVQGPGDRFQIDATIADVYLISEFDRRRIVGRPVIYFVIDVFSRLITGVYVGFEGPSWVGAMMALVSMVTPKIEFCRQYGIDIEESDWPAHYAPRRILADRGELLSVNLGKNIIEHLLIEIENTSPGRADLKALVERRFGIVPANFKPFAPGYVEKDFNNRGAKDYRLEAALSLFEFTKLVIYAVMEHNFSPIRDLKIPAEMVTEHLTTAPIDLWQWGIANRSGSLRLLTTDEVSLEVMPTDNCRITAKGIFFKGSYYNCIEANEKEWFTKARRSSWSIPVSYDPRDLSLIYIRDRTLPNGFSKCRLLNQNDQNNRKSLFEIEEINIAKKRLEAEGENKRQEKRIFIDEKMEEIKKSGTALTNTVKDLTESKLKRTKNIRYNRLNEKSIQRSSESFHISFFNEIDKNTIETIGTNVLNEKNHELSLLKGLKLEQKIDDK